MNDRDQMEAEEREERLRDAAQDLLDALNEAYRLAVAHGWAPAHREAWKAAIDKAEGREP